jgi:hypothetical protein
MCRNNSIITSSWHHRPGYKMHYNEHITCYGELIWILMIIESWLAHDPVIVGT